MSFSISVSTGKINIFLLQMCCCCCFFLFLFFLLLFFGNYSVQCFVLRDLLLFLNIRELNGSAVSCEIAVFCAPYFSQLFYVVEFFCFIYYLNLATVVFFPKLLGVLIGNFLLLP